jgi:hypothetical protein
MKILILNPHQDHSFGITLERYISKTFCAKKYAYLIYELLGTKHSDIKLYFYITLSRRTLLNYFVKIVRLYLWGILNKYNIFKFRFVFKSSSIDSYDCFFALARNCYSSDIIKDLKDTKIPKFIHLTHFMNNTGGMSENFKDLKNLTFVSENNLSSNSVYFKKHFTYYKKEVLVLPFVYQDRFQNYTNFKQRKNKCFACGSLSIFNKGEIEFHKDWEEFFKIDTYHPMRKEIYLNKEKYSNIIDSYINNHLGNNGLGEYYKFNLVEKFNEYKLFIAPEEVHGLPALSFVEGMASGSVFVGLNNAMYQDFGMVSGVHYIGYDETIEDMIEKVQYYLNNESELEKIYMNSYKFVIDNFNATTVTERFLENIKRRIKCQ